MSPQIAMRWRTPSAAMSLPRPRVTISPRSITRCWSASSSAHQGHAVGTLKTLGVERGSRTRHRVAAP